jgi:carbon storage regulator
MLILSRNVNECIKIGIGDSVITVMVVRVKGERVWLGIEAPRDVPVHRQEIWDVIHGKHFKRPDAEPEK